MQPSFTLASVRRQAFVLAYLGTAQLLLFLIYAAHNFWWGGRTLLLKVQAHEIANGRPPLSRFIDSPVGAYSTGSQGTLLYRADSFGDQLLFYNIGSITIVDVLFAFAVGLFLCRVLLRLRAGHEFSTRLSQAFTTVGLCTMITHVIKMLFNTGITQLFEARTHSLFYLDIQPTGFLYMFMGVLLFACAQLLRRGEELQQEIDLTV
ncbi:DUF2975 domain-containing protein [Hymenobacter sp.]|uniref:DUF2975 domain-containing protein n=1 Tax=Hymenobacter sp. TaxID=1898978 RepID=UPI00286CA2A1|nr:DUF2975 domain-containing protein [Hymenobacter sp.]